MSSLNCKFLAETHFLETHATYNENTELIYLFNATVFNYKPMEWAVVVHMRGNKASTEFYQLAFKLMFKTCYKEHQSFKVGTSLKGIIFNWSDTEAKELCEVIGEDTTGLVMKGCNVHWIMQIIPKSCRKS